MSTPSARLQLSSAQWRHAFSFLPLDDLQAVLLVSHRFHRAGSEVLHRAFYAQIRGLRLISDVSSCVDALATREDRVSFLTRLLSHSQRLLRHEEMRNAQEEQRQLLRRRLEELPAWMTPKERDGVALLSSRVAVLAAEERDLEMSARVTWKCAFKVGGFCGLAEFLFSDTRRILHYSVRERGARSTGARRASVAEAARPAATEAALGRLVFDERTVLARAGDKARVRMTQEARDGVQRLAAAVPSSLSRRCLLWLVCNASFPEHDRVPLVNDLATLPEELAKAK